MKKRSTVLLCVALALILLGSILANLFNTGMGTVTVSRIRFDAEHGELSGLLYMPKDASESNPKPTVIVTHGYLNSAEMQDANAIELSRRGFVVLALDQYDHGHSALNHDVYSDTSFFGMWLPFWVHSMNDAVQYMYEQPYVLKDEEGNGMIGVTGHSMGGFSSTMALAMDEMQFSESGVRKVYAGLTEGSDFTYTPYAAFVGAPGVDAATAAELGGGRYMGKVAAQYDEFFFNDPTVEGGTVRKKDFVSTPDGMAFLERTEPGEAGVWYEKWDLSDKGHRIIYEPAQTHPWNHFSVETTAYAVNFYQVAFADYGSQLKEIYADDQIWMYKEAAECVALVGFVMLIIAIASLLLEAPFFRLARTELPAVQPAPKGGRWFVTFVILLVAILLPAIFFSPLMDDGAGSASVNILFYAGLVVAAGGLIALIAGGKSEHAKAVRIGGCVMILAGGLLALIAKTPMYQTSAFWSALGINSIAYWTIGCALMSLCILSTVYVCMKARDGADFAAYGVSFKPTVIFAGLCTALLTVVLAYAVLFLMDKFFLADFRIWTFAFKTFDGNILPVILRYLPTFLLFYLISTAGIMVNTNNERLKGFWGYLLAIALNAGGAMIWLARQYITLFSTGVAAHPGSALSGIMLVAMVPTLSIAAIISRNLYKKTGNIWTAGFLNGILMTTMTIANTMVAFK